MRFPTRLAVLLVLSTLALGGCDVLNGAKPLSTTPETKSAENDVVSYVRTTVVEVRRGSVFKVHVEVVAKEDLELLAVSETVPEGFSLEDSAPPTKFLTNVAAGESIELDYRVKAGKKKGSFPLTGFARAKLAGEDSVQLELVSPLKVR